MEQFVWQLIHHDLYHAGEINWQRELVTGAEGWTTYVWRARDGSKSAAIVHAVQILIVSGLTFTKVERALIDRILAAAGPGA